MSGIASCAEGDSVAQLPHKGGQRFFSSRGRLLPIVDPTFYTDISEGLFLRAGGTTLRVGQGEQKRDGHVSRSGLGWQRAVRMSAPEAPADVRDVTGQPRDHCTANAKRDPRFCWYRRPIMLSQVVAPEHWEVEMLKSADTGLRPLPFPIDDPGRFPSQRYHDPELNKMEVEHLWPHVWQMACRLEQIPVLTNNFDAGIKDLGF
jgi:hypothetical protein